MTKIQDFPPDTSRVPSFQAWNHPVNNEQQSGLMRHQGYPIQGHVDPLSEPGDCRQKLSELPTTKSPRLALVEKAKVNNNLRVFRFTFYFLFLFLGQGESLSAVCFFVGVCFYLLGPQAAARFWRPGISKGKLTPPRNKRWTEFLNPVSCLRGPAAFSSCTWEPPK